MPYSEDDVIVTDFGSGELDVVATNVTALGAIVTDGGDVTLSASEHVGVWDYGILTLGGNVRLNSDRDADGSGGILVAFAFIGTDGGDIVFGGGTEPETMYAGSGDYFENTNDGVITYFAEIDSAGGDISIRGQGGPTTDDLSFHDGVSIEFTDITSGAGSITIEGRAGNETVVGQSVQAIGVLVTAGSIIESTDGAISITGQGGTSSTDITPGVSVTNLEGAVDELNGIASTGSGTVTLQGTGGSTGAQPLFNPGVVVGFGSSFVEVAEGPLSVTGTGGDVAPGGSPGQIEIDGDVAFSASASFLVEIEGTTPLSEHDQLCVVGMGRTVSLIDATLDLTLASGFTPGPIQRLVLIDNVGPTTTILGEFAGMAEGELLSLGGVPFHITYHGGDGNDVELFVDAAIIDNDDTGYSDSGNLGFPWLNQGFASDVREMIGAGKSATYTFTGLQPGMLFEVAATWNAFLNRESQAPYTISGGEDGPLTVTLDQRQAPNDFNRDEVAWESLGVVRVGDSGTLTVTLNSQSSRSFIADAVNKPSAKAIRTSHQPMIAKTMATRINAMALRTRRPPISSESLELDNTRETKSPGRRYVKNENGRRRKRSSSRAVCASENDFWNRTRETSRKPNKTTPSRMTPALRRDQLPAAKAGRPDRKLSTPAPTNSEASTKGTPSNTLDNRYPTSAICPLFGRRMLRQIDLSGEADRPPR